MCTGTVVGGKVQAETLNKCQLVGGVWRHQRCDSVNNLIVVDVFNRTSACQGTPRDTYRLPTGCLPTLGGNSNNEVCVSTNNLVQPYAVFGPGIVTMSTASNAVCGMAQQQDPSWQMSMAVSWQFQPLSTCIVPSDGSTPSMITDCSTSARTFSRSLYAGAQDCSGTPSSQETVALFGCAKDQNRLYTTEVCYSP